MNKEIDKRLTQLEGPISTNNVPIIDNKSPLVLFYKKTVEGKILYINVQNHKIESFVAEEYSQMHQNTSFELFYVLSGKVIKRIEDKEYIYKRGQGCLLNRRITHAEVLEDGYLLILNISEDFLKDVLHALPHQQQERPLFQFLTHYFQRENNWQRRYIEFASTTNSALSQIQDLLEAIQLELAENKVGTKYFQKGYVLRLLDLLEDPSFFYLNTVNIDLNKEDYLVSRLISLIEMSNGNITRKEIDNQLHYNPEYLNRLLKKHNGYTITTYAKDIKMRQAKRLLENTDLKIAAIAEALGFSTENYFYRYFKDNTGISPNQYRKKTGSI